MSTHAPAPSVHIDGERFANAFKAITATLGSDRASADTHDILWIKIWNNHGVEMSTFDETSTSTAWVPRAADTDRPDIEPDTQTTIRMSGHFKFLARTVGATSDGVLELAEYVSPQMSIPLHGASVPSGVKVTSTTPTATVSLIEQGVGVVHSDVDWREHALTADPRPATGFGVSDKTLAAITKIAAAVGPIECLFGVKNGTQRVTVTPVEDDLGFEFVAMLALPDIGFDDIGEGE